MINVLVMPFVMGRQHLLTKFVLQALKYFILKLCKPHGKTNIKIAHNLKNL